MHYKIWTRKNEHLSVKDFISMMLKDRNSIFLRGLRNQRYNFMIFCVSCKVSTNCKQSLFPFGYSTCSVKGHFFHNNFFDFKISHDLKIFDHIFLFILVSKIDETYFLLIDFFWDHIPKKVTGT